MLASIINKCTKVVEALRECFTVSATDKDNFFLGMKIERNRINLTLYMLQTFYLNKMLICFNLGGTSSEILIRSGFCLQKATSYNIEAVITKPLRELIGSLMYLACTSCPDFMFATSCLARYDTYYVEQHWTCAKRVLKYLCSKKHVDIMSRKRDGNVVGYTDSD